MMRLGQPKHRHQAALVLAAVVLLSRLPFLSSGLGDDPDGYRVSIAVRHLAAFGQYIPSRPPGYPLPEYFGALLSQLFPLDALLLNVPNAVASAVATYVVVLMLDRYGRFRALIVAATLAFTPAVYKASSLPLDYMIGFMFFALSLYLAAERRAVILAAVCLGLAAACRPTYALAIVPIALAVQEGPGLWPISLADRWRLLKLSVVSGLIAILFYAPLFLRSGLAWLTFADHGIEITHLLLHGTVDLFGLVGSLGILSVAVQLLVRRSMDVRSLTADRLGLALLTASLIYIVLFLRLPDQPYYLIPALPGIYLMMAISVSTVTMTALCASLVLSSFVGSIEQDQAGAAHFQLAGPLAKRVATEARWACVTADITAALAANDGSHVVASYLAPVILASDHPPPTERVLYLATPTDGGWHTAAGQRINGGPMFVVDAVAKAQDRFAPGSLPRMQMIDTGSCSHGTASAPP